MTGVILRIAIAMLGTPLRRLDVARQGSRAHQVLFELLAGYNDGRDQAAACVYQPMLGAHDLLLFLVDSVSSVEIAEKQGYVVD